MSTKAARRAFGKRLRAAREDKCLSLTKFAHQVGVAPPTAWGWENGDYSPSMDSLRKITAVLDKSSDELLGEAA